MISHDEVREPENKRKAPVGSDTRKASAFVPLLVTYSPLQATTKPKEVRRRATTGRSKKGKPQGAENPYKATGRISPLQ